MDPIVNRIIENAHMLIENEQFEPINKYNRHLIEVQHNCLHNPMLMGRIPAEDAGDVGIAFFYLLDLTDESNISVYPTYSSISFYLLQKALYQGREAMSLVEHDRYITSMIKLMNIGARSFCRTIARAYGIEPINYINFADWQHLPAYIKMVLLLEYSYIKAMLKQTNVLDDVIDIYYEISQEVRLRYDFLTTCARNGYFDDIFEEGALDGWQIQDRAEKVKKKVFNYVSMKIESGDFIFR